MSQLSVTDRVTAFLCEYYKLPAEKVADMLPTFLNVLQNHMIKMEKTVAEGDIQSIGNVGHTLKGALMNLGLDDFAEIAQTIEREGKAGRSEVDYSGLVDQLKENMAEIL
ncbi:MAG TPA: Hpt domain-containing protein [Desulfobacterales bacterium]|nr:Hpt domain-containing protein [Desulfobacterales bacterium]HIP40527.1 Hpt domain-containing protein [Desulfocapsa sulfexigens]